MDQSKSNDQGASSELAIPPRSLTTEFYVGFFTILTLGAVAYLSVGLGEVELGGSSYEVRAEFDNISGLKEGGSVEIAGVKIGSVTTIGLDTQGEFAQVTMRINREHVLRGEDVAAIRTKGIIGDRFVKISRGSTSAPAVKPGERLVETESVVDFEDLIGKIISNFTGEKDAEKE